MRTGLRTCTSTSFLTEDSMVAEKNMVWRSAGMTDMIRLMEGRKPMSSMRSASSRIRMRTLLNSIKRRSRKSQKRPGVATTMAAPARICLSCTRLFVVGVAGGGAAGGFFCGLSVLFRAAGGGGGGVAGPARHFPDHLGDLQRQFAGRRQNDAADAGLRSLVEQQLDGRQYKRKGLSSSGLGGGDEVAAGQRRLDGLGLDGGWLGEVLLREIAHQLSGKR